MRFGIGRGVALTGVLRLGYTQCFGTWLVHPRVGVLVVHVIPVTVMQWEVT